MANAQDMTGKKAEQLRREHAAELEAKAAEMTLLHQAEIEANKGTVDLTKPEGVPVVIDDVVDLSKTRPTPEVIVEEPVIVVTTPEEEFETIRVAEDLPEVSIGSWSGSLKQGQKYKVPKNVAFHLREKGRLYERS